MQGTGMYPPSLQSTRWTASLNPPPRTPACMKPRTTSCMTPRGRAGAAHPTTQGGITTPACRCAFEQSSSIEFQITPVFVFVALAGIARALVQESRNEKRPSSKQLTKDICLSMAACMSRIDTATSANTNNSQYHHVVLQELVHDIGMGSNINSTCDSTHRSGRHGPEEVVAAASNTGGSATGKSDDSKSKNWFVQVRTCIHPSFLYNRTCEIVHNPLKTNQAINLDRPCPYPHLRRNRWAKCNWCHANVCFIAPLCVTYGTSKGRIFGCGMSHRAARDVTCAACCAVCEGGEGA